MPEYLSPGVYVEEIDTGPRPIEGVSTSTAGMVGVTERGPVGVPILVTSNGAFKRHFGGYLDSSFASHRFFPHTVEGFFQNGGQRAYVVRALDTDNAQYARRQLFDRGEGGGAESVLLRSAAEHSGTSANLPLLYAVDAAGIAQGNFVRVGDGSASEYREVAANPVDDSHITLNFPLNYAHDAGATIEQFNRVADVANFNTAVFMLAEAAPEGSNDVLLEETGAGDAALLAADQLLEIGGVLPSNGEHHFIQSATSVTATQTRVELGVPMAQDYAVATEVTILDLTPVNRVDTAALDREAHARDAVVFVDDPAVPFSDRADIVVIDQGSANQEARRIGQLSILSLATRPYDIYPTGTFVERVQMNNDARAIVNAITLDSSAGFAAGRTLIVDRGGANEEALVVERVYPIANQVVFPAAFANAHGAGETVALVHSINQPGPAPPPPQVGDTSLILDSVDGLAVGQVLQVGSGGTQEPVLVTAIDIPNTTITFAGPGLTNAQADGEPVALEHTITSLNASAGDDAIVLDSVDGLVVGQGLVVGAPANEEPAVVQATDATSHTVSFVDPLSSSHNIGDPVQLGVTELINPVEVGVRSVTLASRLTLNEGDVLRIGTAPNAEFVVIDSIPSQTHVPPDAGAIALTHPLENAYAAGTEVSRQGDPTVLATQRGYLLHEANPRRGEPVVTDGNAYSNGDVIRARLASGDEFFHFLSDDADTPTSRLVELVQPLGNAHAPGDALVERQSLIEVQALDAGRWGDRLRVSIEDEPTGLVAHTTLRAIVDSTHIRLASAAGVEPGTILHFPDPNTGEFQNPHTGEDLGTFVKVGAVDRNDFTLTLSTALPGNQQVVGRPVRSREFRITLFLLRHPDPAQPSLDNTVINSEVYRHLSMDDRHSRYIVDVIGAIDGELRQWDRRPAGTSRYIRVRDVAQNNPGVRPPQLDHAVSRAIRLGPETLRDTLPNGQTRPARHPLSGGDDSIPTIQHADYIGIDAADPEARTGIQSLRNIDEVSIVAVPGQVAVEVQNALISHCEADRYRFAVLDGPSPPDDTLTDVQAQRQSFDTRYAAVYHPWLHIPEPFPTRLDEVPDMSVPPSGHVIGVYARTDNNRGVHKAPANEVIRGIRGLRRTLTKGEQDILNPSPVNINVIRDFRTDFRGLRVWGARCITSDTAFKYVPVRRLLIFIEESIDEGLQWVVFEPNAEPLWARVRRTISDFLRVVWRNGALEGTSEEQAFFVRCDRTTMTQADIDNGRLICVIGVAPVKPAEFVIIQIGLKTVEAES